MFRSLQRLLILAVLAATTARGEPVLVAVASNFASTAEELAAQFEASTGHDLRFATASTGKLYAQIVNGAPFDVLLAADDDRPQRLEESGHGVAGTRFTYAIGRLVLWSRDPRIRDCRAALEDPETGRVAIANPDSAPYGAAARDFLRHERLWESVQSRLVVAENVSQSLQFAATGNASLAFVAESHLRKAGLPETGCRWQVPGELHAPIEQQAVLLSRAADSAAARSWLEYLGSEAARRIIEANGYDVPGTAQ